MGEAKRRKQKLGAAYGQTPSLRRLTNQQLEAHLDKFRHTWREKIEKFNPISRSTVSQKSDSKFPFFVSDDYYQWLDRYLQNYHPKDREQLAGAIIDPIYALLPHLIEDEETESDEVEELMGEWLLSALFVYDCFKPYLSDSEAQNYALPLKSFYENIILMSIESTEVGEKLEKFKNLFEEILGINNQARQV